MCDAAYQDALHGWGCKRYEACQGGRGNGGQVRDATTWLGTCQLSCQLLCLQQAMLAVCMHVASTMVVTHLPPVARGYAHVVVHKKPFGVCGEMI